ncbi:ATP-binding protein [Streptacidiphilus sp. MAP12-16]|uniref:sensor histidine kinase n=1 Tax=Streptacidiphilus sp. MAP12-16 TaxID=3156300 RepID=UPI0035145CE7
MAYLLRSRPADPYSGAPLVVLAVAAAGAAVALIAAAGRARAADRWVAQRVEALRSSSNRGEGELWQLVEQLQRGERPLPHHAGAPPVQGADAFEVFAHELERYRQSAAAAVVQAATFVPGGGPDQRVGVFVNLARRLQSLVHREIQLLDELEAQVEDPDLLKGLFSVDHLATRIRRHAENLAVLGGAVPRRQWSRPVTMYEVLRSAVAEVEHYSRVKLVLPAEGTLRGHAVADVVHLIAELVENATMFSSPNTQVLLRAQKVTAGVAIEVEDRGLGMSHDERHAMNSLLADPDRVDVGALLDDGRIGLFVVAALARRHAIAVQLQTNIYGGTQAVLVLPHDLLGAPQGDRETTPRDRTEQMPPSFEEPTPALAAPAPVAPSLASPPRVPQPLPAQQQMPVPHSMPQSMPAPQPVPLPVREPGAWPLGTGRPAQEPAQAAAAAPGGAIPSGRPAAPGLPPERDDIRPPLPKRTQQAHLAPQLRDAPAQRHGESAPDYDPGLMAAFQRGVSRSDADSEAADGQPDADHRTS